MCLAFSENKNHLISTLVLNKVVFVVAVIFVAVVVITIFRIRSFDYEYLFI